jgi:hypothetical protein
MTFKTYALVAISSAILVGCASGPKISAEDCAGADWYAVGVQHGKVGANITEINPAVQACGETATPVNIDRYNEGRSEGLKTFCTPLTLLDAAAQGKGDPYACDPITSELKASIDKGVETRAAIARYQQYQAQYKQLTDQRAQVQSQLDQINQEGQRLTQMLQSATDQTNPTRAQIQERIQYLRQQQQAGNQQLGALNEEIKKADPIMRTEKQTYDQAVQSYNSYKSSLGGSN